jgi:hypothetical protein
MPSPDEPTFKSADDDLNAYAFTADQVPEGVELPDPFAEFQPEGDIDIEAEARAELEHLADTLEHSGFRDRLAKESARMQLVLATDYWFCVSFGTEEQANAFLDEMDWRKHGTRYLDGRMLAAQQGIALPDDPDWPMVPPAPARWAQRAHTVDENRSFGKEEA